MFFTTAVCCVWQKSKILLYPSQLLESSQSVIPLSACLVFGGVQVLFNREAQNEQTVIESALVFIGKYFHRILYTLWVSTQEAHDQNPKSIPLLIHNQQSDIDRPTVLQRVLYIYQTVGKPPFQ